MSLFSTSKTSTGHKNVLLFLIVLNSFINPFMGAAVNIALPRMASEFSMNTTMMGWVTMSFLLASVAVLLPVGKIADITGRKKVFILGNLIVTLSSLFCAVSGNTWMMILFRVIQGIGGAMMFGTGTAMITSAFPPEQRGRALGINVSAVYLGLTLAPLLGGFLTDYFGWRSIFWLNVPFGILSLLITLYAVKAEWREAHGESFDLKGSVIYMMSISMLMYGISHIPDVIAILLLVAGTGGLVLFVMNESRVKIPILDMRLFTENRVFAFSNLSALINYAATFAVTFLLSLYLQYIRGMIPSDAGLVLVTQPILMTVVASFSGRLSDTIDPRILASVGMGIIVIGLGMLGFIGSETSSLYLISCLVILGAGFGLFSSPNTNAVMSSVEKKYLGVASATIGTMRVAGQMMSMAIATLVLHNFMGNSNVNPSNHVAFLGAARLTFAVFAVLCLVGVFASLARGKKGVDLNRIHR
jgi:EmrB/QacA subfamily drug resistance transporter